MRTGCKTKEKKRLERSHKILLLGWIIFEIWFENVIIDKVQQKGVCFKFPIYTLQSDFLIYQFLKLIV